MAAYLTIAELKLRTVMPPEFLDALEGLQPGWIDAQLEQMSRWIDSRLMKRYAVPFIVPYPEVVLGWLARLVAYEAWQRRGWDPQDPQAVQIQRSAEQARDDVKEAADAVQGLYDLPTIEGKSTITKPRTFGYTEQSPYVWLDAQVMTGRDEDDWGGGSYG
jgi:hypothetical protein